MLSRTFGYRRLYVDAVCERGPHRAVLAVWSEVMRLSFVALACALFAAILWMLAAAAYAREGLFSLWTLGAGVCALAASAGVLAAVGGALAAARDLHRVRLVAGERRPR